MKGKQLNVSGRVGVYMYVYIQIHSCIFQNICIRVYIYMLKLIPTYTQNISLQEANQRQNNRFGDNAQNVKDV